MFFNQLTLEREIILDSSGASESQGFLKAEEGWRRVNQRRRCKDRSKVRVMQCEKYPVSFADFDNRGKGKGTS
jgi:hypothetical protein